MRNWKLASAVVMALGAQAAYAELSVTPAVVSDYDWKRTPFVGQCGSRREVESASQRYAAKDRDRIPA